MSRKYIKDRPQEREEDSLDLEIGQVIPPGVYMWDLMQKRRLRSEGRL